MMHPKFQLNHSSSIHTPFFTCQLLHVLAQKDIFNTLSCILETVTKLLK